MMSGMVFSAPALDIRGQWLHLSILHLCMCNRSITWEAQKEWLQPETLHLTTVKMHWVPLPAMVQVITMPSLCLRTVSLGECSCHKKGRPQGRCTTSATTTNGGPFQPLENGGVSCWYLPVAIADILNTDSSTLCRCSPTNFIMRTCMSHDPKIDPYHPIPSSVEPFWSAPSLFSPEIMSQTASGN
jgi:hypothetical protein